jgi:tetratricopeptide (TPR) repeat protein
MEMAAENYEKAIYYSEKCIALESNLGDCWWNLGLSEIYLKNFEKAKEYIEISGKKRFQIDDEKNLSQLLSAYIKTKNYQELISTYNKLIEINPSNFQYHASLAFAYKNVGDYVNAKKEAEIVLQLSPESKSNVDEFLKTLPY